jgi:hypothetical protein
MFFVAGVVVTWAALLWILLYWLLPRLYERALVEPRLRWD